MRRARCEEIVLGQPERLQGGQARAGRYRYGNRPICDAMGRVGEDLVKVQRHGKGGEVRSQEADDD